VTLEKGTGLSIDVLGLVFHGVSQSHFGRHRLLNILLNLLICGMICLAQWDIGGHEHVGKVLGELRP